jgi:hypothetical protein
VQIVCDWPAPTAARSLAARVWRERWTSRNTRTDRAGEKQRSSGSRGIWLAFGRVDGASTAGQECLLAGGESGVDGPSGRVWSDAGGGFATELRQSRAEPLAMRTALDAELGVTVQGTGVQECSATRDSVNSHLPYKQVVRLLLKTS